MKVSPGFISAMNTAWLAWLPEFGCTLANLQSNSRLARSIARFLGDVDELAAAVIAPARIALGIFVGHHRALRFEHGAGDDVFGGDQLDFVALAAEFELDGAGDLRIAVGEARRRRFESCWRDADGWVPASLALWVEPRLPANPAGAERARSAWPAFVRQATANLFWGQPTGSGR